MGENTDELKGAHGFKTVEEDLFPEPDSPGGQIKFNGQGMPVLRLNRKHLCRFNGPARSFETQDLQACAVLLWRGEQSDCPRFFVGLKDQSTAAFIAHRAQGNSEAACALCFFL